MAEAPAHSHSQTISAYPSCEHCLTWSEAGIAIAGGENIYFASGNNAHSKHSPDHGRIQVLRVDHFDRDEWPDLPMATIADASFGEEQSESVVAALAWSLPGLGIHRRCVLCVLTSNLVLSLWETDGSPNSWRRTCVINNYVSSQTLNASGEPAAESRKSNRVRAFTWLPALKQFDGDRWGFHLLLTADDAKTLTLWRIDKKEKQKYGSWLVETIAKGRLPDSLSTQESTSLTALQLSLLRAQRVGRFMTDSWQQKRDTEGDCLTLNVAALFSNSPSLNLVVSIQLRVVMNEKDLSADIRSSYDFEDNGAIDSTMLRDHDHYSSWERELETISADYRRKFQLRHIRTRFWGFAHSPNHDGVATVVTLHPRDSYEYTTANTEKSWLITKYLDGVATVDDGNERTLQEVRKNTLTYITHAIEHETRDAHELDQKLLTVWNAWTAPQTDLNDEHEILSSHMQHQLTERNVSNVQALDTQTADDRVPEPPPAETCSICRSPLSVNIDSQYSTCKSGHTFPRCTLSLLAIQEPRISKSCTKCERQFLDLSKLGPLSSRTLIAELFDKFDVCPVCEGKYRS